MSSSDTLGANTALKMMSRYSSGMEPQISMKRWNARSTLPPKKPWIAPVSTPSSTPVTVSARPNSTLTRKPYSNCASGSRPRSSVPSQLSVVGADGLGTWRSS